MLPEGFVRYFIEKKDFSYSNCGGKPIAVINGNNGKLYGIAEYGLNITGSVLFKYNPATGALVNKANINGLNSEHFENSLMLASDNNI